MGVGIYGAICSGKAACWAALLTLFFIPVSEMMFSGELDNAFPLPLLAVPDGRTGNRGEGRGSKRFSPEGPLSPKSTCRLLMSLSRFFIQHRSLFWIQMSVRLNIKMSAWPKSPPVIVPASVCVSSFSCAFPLPLLEERREVSWERVLFIFFFNRQNGTNRRNLSFEC